MYYLHKDSLNVIYNERKKLIISFYEDALQSEKELNLSYALQLYYYSMILMDSIPIEEINYYGDNLRVTVKTKINNILTGIKFLYEGDNFPQNDVRDVHFKIEFNGKPVEVLEFSYIEQSEQIKTIGKGGRALCRLTGACTGYSKLNVEIQYKFSQNKEQFKEVSALWHAIIKPKFNNKQTIHLKKIEKTKKNKTKAKYANNEYKFNFTNSDTCLVTENIANSIYTFLNCINNKNVESTYSSDKFISDKISMMIKFNNIEVVDEKYDFAINKTYEGWEVRSIPIYCSYPSIHKQSVEYLVLDFNDKGVLQDVNFSVFNMLYNSYVSNFKNDDSYKKRQVIVKFLEKYRSAYQNRDLKTLKRIFSDKAVIIVGRLMPTGKANREIQQSISDSQPNIDYLKMTKQEYLKRQKNIFITQDDIHLGFSTCKVNQNNNDNDLFGISMRQEYASTGYSDEGYLFLLIDFKGTDPMIYVRSWQPSEWDEKALINMTNFRLKK